MEIKATLKQPYTENERTDFIVEQNHKNGYEIRETDISLEAWGYTEEEKQQQERQRLDFLVLTPSDVERALYYSPLQMDFDDLKALIAEKAPQIDLKGLAIEFRANNFYRGAVDKDGNRIIDMVGAILGYTPEDMDYLFEHKQLPVHEEPVVEPEATTEEPVTEPVVEPEATTEEPVTEPVVEPEAEETVEE